MNNAKGEALIALCDTIKALGTDELGSYKVQNVVRNYDLIVNNEESFSFEGVGVVMKDAIGMSIYYDEAEDLFAGNYTVKVGNNPITVTPDTATFGEGENAKTYGCIDIFVNVADAQKNITVEICDAEGNTVFKVATTVEFLASAYDNNVDAANMLAYIQAANAYHKLPQAA